MFSITNLFYNFLLDVYSNFFIKWFSIIGFFLITYLFINTFRTLWNKFCVREKDLIGRYGHGSWAVITGAAHGTGKAFAYELGKRGFNLVLMDKNGENVNEVSQTIQMKYPEVEVMKVITDFRNCQKEGFFEAIASELSRLDVSMLVNNVGIIYGGKFTDQSEKEVQDIFNVNMITPILLTKKLLPRLAERGSKSAVITVSDNEALCSYQDFTTAFGTSKNALIYFMCSLKHEFGNKIDLLTVTPMKFSSRKTNIAPFHLDKINPQGFVRSTLKSLGNTNMSFGNWRHEIWGPIFNTFLRGKNLRMPRLTARLPTWSGMKQKLGFKPKVQ